MVLSMGMALSDTAVGDNVGEVMSVPTGKIYLSTNQSAYIRRLQRRIDDGFLAKQDLAFYLQGIISDYRAGADARYKMNDAGTELVPVLELPESQEWY